MWHDSNKLRIYKRALDIAPLSLSFPVPPLANDLCFSEKRHFQMDQIYLNDKGTYLTLQRIKTRREFFVLTTPSLAAVHLEYTRN